ncbi:hypothetical protein [Natronospora cellulosivora (SeqCode)]
MITLSTFEDVFNKLVELYQGKEVEVISKQDDVHIANFLINIDNISIKPLSKKKSKKWNKSGHKVGLIIVKAKKSGNSFNIPFLLGFNTMKATFLKDGVSIKSLNMEFIIKKARKKRKALRKAN